MMIFFINDSIRFNYLHRPPKNILNIFSQQNVFSYYVCAFVYFGFDAIRFIQKHILVAREFVIILFCHCPIVTYFQAYSLIIENGFEHFFAQSNWYD